MFFNRKRKMTERTSHLEQQFLSSLTDQVIAIRHKRRYVEEHRLQTRRAWANEGIVRHYKSTTRPDYNIPAARRAAERVIVRAVKMMTPTPKFFEVFPIGKTSNDKVANVDKYMSYIYRKKIKIRSIISQLLRCMVLYGICHLKTSVKVINGQVLPYQRVIDPFSLYIYPETTTVIDDASLIFEDYLMGYDEFYPLMSKGIYDSVNRSDLVKPEWPYHLIERLAYKGITDVTDSDSSDVLEKARDNAKAQLNKVGSNFLSLTELWKVRDGKLFQIYILWNHRSGPRIIGIKPSVYTEPLIRSVVYRPLPGELYTSGIMSDIIELNSLQNDQLAQFQDAVDWEQGLMIGDATKRHEGWVMGGRKLWLHNGDPKNDFNFVQTPVTSTNHLRAWQIYNGMINSMGGAGTIAEGQPGRNMPRAGNAVNSLIDLGMSDIKYLAELVEEEVLTAGLGDVHKVSVQFIPDEQLMLIPGGEGLTGSVIKPSDIIGDYEFNWIGSQQFQEENLRSQHLLIFLNLLPQLTPMLRAQGYAPDIVELLRMTWRSGLGERGLRDVVVKLEELQQKMEEEATQSSQGVSGLKFNLPNPTNGFVRQS